MFDINPAVISENRGSVRDKDDQCLQKELTVNSKSFAERFILLYLRLIEQHLSNFLLITSENVLSSMIDVDLCSLSLRLAFN